MEPTKRREHPPIYTVLSEIVGWTLDRTADFPKSQRFTFGQRLDNLSLDALQHAVKAIRGRQRPAKAKSLHELDSVLEQLRVLWRLGFFSWYQFSREGNTQGLRRAYARWSLDARLKRRRGKTSRGSGRVVEQQQSRESVVLESQQRQSRQS